MCMINKSLSLLILMHSTESYFHSVQNERLICKQ